MNTRQQIIAAAAGAVVVTIVFFFFALKPKLHEISQARQDIETAQTQQSSLQAELNRLGQLQKNEPQIRAKLSKVAAYLPSTPDLPGFIRQVQAASNASSVELNSIAPSPPSDLTGATGVQTINATLTVHAGFRRIEDFLARMENLDRVVQVQTISLSPVVDPLSGETVLDSTITLTMYVVTDNATATTPGANPSPAATASPTAGATP
jgi:Tfp pilus assembly protein PilO